MSYGDEIKVERLVPIKLIIDLIPTKRNMLKDLYQSKKIVADIGMNYEKIDVCEKNCMWF
jgi:hypothetical protein